MSILNLGAILNFHGAKKQKVSKLKIHLKLIYIYILKSIYIF
jgi:hypothetical protein